jgi:hypothetical protein
MSGARRGRLARPFALARIARAAIDASACPKSKRTRAQRRAADEPGRIEPPNEPEPGAASQTNSSASDIADEPEIAVFQQVGVPMQAQLTSSSLLVIGPESNLSGHRRATPCQRAARCARDLLRQQRCDQASCPDRPAAAVWSRLGRRRALGTTGGRPTGRCRPSTARRRPPPSGPDRRDTDSHGRMDHPSHRLAEVG